MTSRRSYPDGEIAQNLIFDACEATDTEEKFHLCECALNTFPFSVDAYNCIAGLYRREYKDLDKAQAAFEHAVTCARILWPGIEESQEIPWGMIQNRPLLRAYHGLAMTLQDKGETKEAVKHLRFLLRVNPSDNKGARILLFQNLIELGEYAEAEDIAGLHSNGRKSTECYFRYGFVLIDFMKHKLGVCSKKELENTLAEALGVNMFVPYLMLQSENSALESPNYMSPGSMEEAVSYFNSAVGTWRRVPGLIDWLEELKSRDGPKPADDGTILFHLLTKGRLLVVIRRRGESDEMCEVTTNVGTIPGTGLETFSLPPGMKEHNPLKIVCYDTGAQAGAMSRGEFISFSYDDVKEVYFWSLFHLSKTFGKDLEGHHCSECYKAAELRCSKCAVVWYCSKECQRKSWKTSHKKMCKKFIKT
jgi:tetratricopeptide (TPR) repeat protein